METPFPHPASFRDPSGYVFCQDGKIFRAITPCYFRQYDHLTGSGLYDRLVAENLLIPHKEIERTEDAIILEAEKIPFITYPCEWSFEQYRDAALLTLAIQKRAMEFGMVLKDATAFNVAFRQCRPCFIDTLSFDFYEEGRPWHAYGQFCSHFFAPLLLARHLGVPFLASMSHYIDGVPLDLCSRMLPWRSRFSLSTFANIHLPAKFTRKYEEGKRTAPEVRISRRSLLNIISNLSVTIAGMGIKGDTEWAQYYSKTNYTKQSFTLKQTTVMQWINEVRAERVWDAGGNDGYFASLLGDCVGSVVVSDADPTSIGHCYVQAKNGRDSRIIPLVGNVLTPTPATGFKNVERTSFLDRIAEYKPSAILALALIHHLTLTGNVHFNQTAQMFAGISPYLIIEFPGRSDSKVAALLSRKRGFKSLFDSYCQFGFEQEYSRYFQVEKVLKLGDSNRFLYLMRSRNF